MQEVQHHSEQIKLFHYTCGTTCPGVDTRASSEPGTRQSQCQPLDTACNNLFPQVPYYPHRQTDRQKDSLLSVNALQNPSTRKLSRMLTAAELAMMPAGERS
jgi:hypothetical protein